MSKRSLKLEIMQKMTELATAGFGLVAALAWNDAIQSLFKKLFGTQSEVWAKFVYALIITGLVVLITMRLGNLVDKLKHQDNNDSEK